MSTIRAARVLLFSVHLCVCLSVNAITPESLEISSQNFQGIILWSKGLDKFDNSYIGVHGWWLNVSHVLQCESKNTPPPPRDFLTFFPKRLGILVQISHVYYTFLSTLDNQLLFNYLQLWRSYAVLSIQFTSYAQNVHHQPKRTLGSRT